MIKKKKASKFGNFRLRGVETEAEVLAFVKEFKTRHNGISPTMREIADACKLASTSTVDYHLENLGKAGKIYFVGSRASRAICLPGYQFIQQEAQAE